MVSITAVGQALRPALISVDHGLNKYIVFIGLSLASQVNLTQWPEPDHQ